MKIRKKHMAEMLARMCKTVGACPRAYCAKLRVCPFASNVTCSSITPKHWLEVELPDEEGDKMK